MGFIYHVIAVKEWEEAKRKGSYEAPSLETEGFIHCSKENQVGDVLERYYKDVKNLRLLKIDESKLTAPLKYEISTGDELYPHLFGPLNLNAVVEVVKMSDEDADANTSSRVALED